MEVRGENGEGGNLGLNSKVWDFAYECDSDKITPDFSSYFEFCIHLG